jgi:hypothetical protein
MKPIRTLPGSSGLTGRSQFDVEVPRTKASAAGRWAADKIAALESIFFDLLNLFFYLLIFMLTGTE